MAEALAALYGQKVREVEKDMLFDRFTTSARRPPHSRSSAASRPCITAGADGATRPSWPCCGAVGAWLVPARPPGRAGDTSHATPAAATTMAGPGGEALAGGVATVAPHVSALGGDGVEAADAAELRSARAQRQRTLQALPGAGG